MNKIYQVHLDIQSIQFIFHWVRIQMA